MASQIKLYVKDGYLIDSIGVIRSKKLKIGYNTDFFPEEMIGDGIDLQQSDLDDSREYPNNKVHTYSYEYRGKKMRKWVVYYNPEQERKQKEQEQKEQACASKVEFLVDDKDHLIIWTRKR
jgi:hypothetical protein